MPKRPQVNTDLGQPEALRTTARPLRSQAPVHSIKQSRAGALAQSLANVVPTLQGYVKEFEDEYRQDEENRAYDEIQGMTFEEAQELVKSGKMRDTDSPWFQAAFEKQFGMVYASKRKRELVDSYNNSFDKHNGDLDTFIAEFAGSDLDKFGGSKFIMSGYREGMGDVLPTLRDNHAEFKSNWTRERVTENFGSIVYDAVGSAVDNGDDLNQVLGLLKGDHRESFGMTFKEMDAHIFETAGRFAAEGNVAAAEAILSTEMVGPDGTVVGSYLTRPQYATKASELLESAKATSGKAAREENTATVVGVQQQAAAGKLDFDLATELRDSEQITLGEYERLIKVNESAQVKATVDAQVSQRTDSLKTEALKAVTSGNAYAIRDETFTDATGKTHTLSRNELIEGAVVDSLDVMAADGAAPGLMAEQLSSYGVDVTYPTWENLMSDGYLTLTENLSGDKDGKMKVPDTALKGYAIWKSLADTPNLRSRHINNRDAEDVWSTAYLLEQNGYDSEDALLRAASPATEAGTAAANGFQHEEFTALADSVKTGWFSELANSSSALGQTEALAKFFVSRGVPKRKAVQQAIKDYEESHTTINGVSVNTRNVYLPNDFEDASLTVLQEFAEMHDEDVDDLTLVPAHDGSNNWTISYKGNVAMPVQVMDGDTHLHISEIERTYAHSKEEAEDTARQAVEEQIAAEKQRQESLLNRENNRRKRAGKEPLTMQQMLAGQEEQRAAEAEAYESRMDRAADSVSEAERLRLTVRPPVPVEEEEEEEEPTRPTGSRARRNNRKE